VSHDYFIAMAYGVSALAVLAEIIVLRVRSRQARRHVEEERALEAQD
jgi:heme exporter protein CcmD